MPRGRAVLPGVGRILQGPRSQLRQYCGPFDGADEEKCKLAVGGRTGASLLRAHRSPDRRHHTRPPKSKRGGVDSGHRRLGQSVGGRAEPGAGRKGKGDTVRKQEDVPGADEVLHDEEGATGSRMGPEIIQVLPAGQALPTEDRPRQCEMVEDYGGGDAGCNTQMAPVHVHLRRRGRIPARKAAWERGRVVQAPYHEGRLWRTGLRMPRCGPKHGRGPGALRRRTRLGHAPRDSPSSHDSDRCGHQKREADRWGRSPTHKPQPHGRARST